MYRFLDPRVSVMCRLLELQGRRGLEFGHEMGFRDFKVQV